MIDNKKMWEAMIDSLRTVGSQTSDELYADLIIALKDQGLVFDIKEKRIISITSEEIRGEANTSKSTDLEQAIFNMLVKRTNEGTISKKQAAEWSPIFLSIVRKQIASEVDVDAIVERHSPSDGVTVQKYTVRAFVRNIVKDVLKEIQKQ